MEALVINLASRPDRWERVREQCASAGVTPIRVEAVPFESVAEEDWRRFWHRAKLQQSMGFMDMVPNPERTVAATLACLRSHVACLERVVDGGPQLVLEDDVQLAPDFLEGMARSVRDGDEFGIDWAAVVGGGYHRIAPVVLTEHTSAARRVRNAHSVWWSRQGAADYLRLLRREALPADVQWDALAVRGRLLCTRSQVSWQEAGQSDIFGKKMTSRFFGGRDVKHRWR